MSYGEQELFKFLFDKITKKQVPQLGSGHLWPNAINGYLATAKGKFGPDGPRNLGRRTFWLKSVSQFIYYLT